MKTTIYYFSATGNSLTTAQKLAERLDNCTLVPAASVMNRAKVIDDSDAVGFVFPVYYGNMAYPMRAAIEKLVLKPEAYVFSVATYRGHAGKAAQRLDALLRTRGQKLSLALGVPMPGNSFINPPEKDQEYLNGQKAAVDALIAPILNRETQDYSTDELLPITPVGYPNNFRGIAAEEDKCIGCGVCAQVCPMNNIRIVGGKAQIGDDCSTCLACFHWCPAEAIWMSQQENIARRSKYHHPDVTAEDIIGQKER